MLDDSLTAGHREEPTRPESPTVTVSDTDDNITRSEARDEHGRKQLGVGDRFAGFVVRGTLGHGAMGVVYEAWDPTLERRVALKLLRSPSRRAAERLLREARALARLDHPGVVRIWAADVHRGAVYIAMELVEGQSLREWMKSPRPWGEILPVMIGAGRGLAAAHAAGVIHRDFKPENVLVGWDGEARVLDFGIARVSAGHPDHLTATRDGVRDGVQDGEGPGEGEASCASEPLSGSFAGFHSEPGQQLTEVGSLVGTLSYMSPEQHEREPADERSDQFGFCTTLFEAIYGVHPFPARNRHQLAARVIEGNISFPAGHGTLAPRWLEKVILRGLSPKREDRYPTMEELIDALERHPARRRRRNRVLTVAAVALGAVALGVMVPRAEPPDPCVDVGHEVDAALGADARKVIADRFASLGQPWAVDMGVRVDAALAGWSGRWVEARTEVCQARHSHREATVLDERRELCLGAQLSQVQALGEVLTEAGTRSLAKAEHMMAALPDPARCVGDEPPLGRSALAGHDAVVGELEQLLWLSLATGEDHIRERAEALVTKVRALPEQDGTQALLADALIVAAHTAMLNGDHGEAEAGLREAARVAERIEADGIRARAVVDLGWALAATPGRAADAVVVLDDADALLDRTGNPRFERERQRQALGEVLLSAGELDRARAVLEANLSDEYGLRDYQPHGTTLIGLARVALAAGDAREALEYSEAALALWEDKVGSGHPRLAAPLTNIGLARQAMGDHVGARAAYERAATLRRAELELEPSPGNRRLLGEILINLANLDSAEGRSEVAADGYREALALIPDDSDSDRALVLFNLGVDHQIGGRPEQALADYREALRLAKRVHPGDSPQVVGARLGVGSMLVALGRPAEAREPLERCLADWPASLRGGADEGELRFGLARARVALDGWSAEAEALAGDARAIYVRLGMGSAAAEVEAWLTEHRPAAE